MENLENISVIVYFVFIIIFMFFGNVTWANREVKSKFLRFLIAVFLFPALGCIFWVFGKVGNFMLLAFSNLF
jgi:hypothetical protein